MGAELLTRAEVRRRISQGQRLLLAGDEGLLRDLPAGNWIGGTIPYFMMRGRGLTTRELICVTTLPDYVAEIEIKGYGARTISQVNNDAPENGFSFIIIPAKSRTHFCFALNAPNFAGFATRPLIGWIAGLHLDDWAAATPKVFNGSNGEAIEEGAIVMHARLPANKIADIGTLSMFEQGDGDRITFAESGFSAKHVSINGRKTDFGDYLRRQRLDKRLPLVTDYYGAMINTAFQEEIGPDGEIQFYNSVFSFLEYRHAKPIRNYTEHFMNKISIGLGQQSIFSCNCILHYLHADLEGRQTDCAPGPMTFGEIAYQTLNQTMVYLRIIDLHLQQS